MVIAIIILAILFVVLFGYMCFVAQTERKEERKQMSDAIRRIDLASAGSDEEGCHLHKRSVDVTSVDTTVYTDDAGNVLNPADYNLFIVDGNSMRLCGIQDRNLIFVTKTLNVAEMKDFPIILVLNKKHVSADRPAFKVRRAWNHLLYTDDHTLMNELKKILQSSSFQEIRNLAEYPGDDEVLEDFKKNRLSRYKEEYIDCDHSNEAYRNIIISSTLNTSHNLIHFSIHPVNRISGEVIASFDMNNDQFHS